MKPNTPFPYSDRPNILSGSTFSFARDEQIMARELITDVAFAALKRYFKELGLTVTDTPTGVTVTKPGLLYGMHTFSWDSTALQVAMHAANSVQSLPPGPISTAAGQTAARKAVNNAVDRASTMLHAYRKELLIGTLALTAGVLGTLAVVTSRKPKPSFIE
jgi:hypothetical protein